eukprot:62794_1
MGHGRDKRRKRRHKRSIQKKSIQKKSPRKKYPHKKKSNIELYGAKQKTDTLLLLDFDRASTKGVGNFKFEWGWMGYVSRSIRLFNKNKSTTSIRRYQLDTWRRPESIKSTMWNSLDPYNIWRILNVIREHCIPENFISNDLVEKWVEDRVKANGCDLPGKIKMRGCCKHRDTVFNDLIELKSVWCRYFEQFKSDVLWIRENKEWLEDVYAVQPWSLEGEEQYLNYCRYIKGEFNGQHIKKNMDQFRSTASKWNLSNIRLRHHWFKTNKHSIAVIRAIGSSKYELNKSLIEYYKTLENRDTTVAPSSDNAPPSNNNTTVAPSSDNAPPSNNNTNNTNNHQIQVSSSNILPALESIDL